MKIPIIGRTYEQSQLLNNLKSQKANFVVCMGRRRIGKSFLIRHVGQSWPQYIEIQGLAPGKKITNKMQIDYFMNQLCNQLKLPEISLKNWDSVFRFMANQITNKKILIFLDEISWMGGKDAKFPGTLKTVWDTELSKQKNLTLIICGSVSSWIEDNILKNTNFLGRISSQLNLNDLSPYESTQFFSKKTSEVEILKTLLLTGGIPKYLEDIANSSSPSTGLSQSFLQKTGFLFNEYEKIFLDIFGKRHIVYAKILLSVLDQPKTFSAICSDQNLPKNGKTSQLIHHLVISGFLRSDEMWNLNSNKDKKSEIYRINDNYLRFYYKTIKPLQKKIENNVLGFKSVDSIPHLSSILGYQFENIIYKNIKTILRIANIEEDELINWGPYYQSKTLRTQACQIDLLIQTKSTIYIFEIKYVDKVTKSHVEEINLKLKKLKYLKKKYSVKTGIIYSFEIEPLIEKKRLIDFGISFSDILKTNVP